MTVSQVFNATAECAATPNPLLRVMSVTQAGSPAPLADFDPAWGIRLRWARAAPDTICGGDFDYTSAVGYFFARDLFAALNAKGGAPAMPVGLIVTSVPGTAIEAWAAPSVLAACNDTAANSQLYNGMIAPLLGVSIRGALWWQGESNSDEDSYACTFPGLISDWRAKWASPAADFPFLFVQLSAYYNESPLSCLAEGGPGLPAYKGSLPRARLRQNAALALPNVGMAVAADLADHAGPVWPGSIHPRWKQPVGWRLHLEARRIAYGEAGLVSRGPQIQRVTALPGCSYDFSCGSYHQKDAVVLRLEFASAGGGLAVATYGASAFTATFNNASFPLSPPCRVTGSIVPGSATRATVDVYFTGDAFCAGGTKGASYMMGELNALFYDMPVVPLFNVEGLPMEPFSVNVTARPPIPQEGVQVWP